MSLQNDRVRVVIDGAEFRGTAEWSDEEGFSAELTGVLKKAEFNRTKKLPPVFLVTINEAERAFLLDPYLDVAGGLTLKMGAPATTSIRLRADGIIRQLPWNIRVGSKLTQVTLTSAALDLWYGEETARVERNFADREITAHFKATECAYTGKLGQLKIGLSITHPGFPAMGDYHFRTQAYATLLPQTPLKLAQVSHVAYALEGLFEILAGFPQRRFAFQVRLDSWPDHDVPLALRAGPQRRTAKDHPYNLFLPRALMPDVTKILAACIEKRESLAIMQNTVRYLSGNRIVLPEGFLTACNVIESIGKDAPNSNANLPQLLEDIARTLKSADRALADRFKNEVQRKIFTHSSFKDRFDHVKSILDDLGVQVGLKHRTLSDTRAAHRHDIVSLKPGDLDIMRTGIGLAWFLGLIWLCQQIGVPRDILLQVAGRDLFHDQRGTDRHNWGAKTLRNAAPS